MSGVAELEAIARRFPPERVAAAIGIAPEVVRSIARTLARTERAGIYARVGVCQNEFGPVASWLVEAVNVVTRHVDREGTTMFPTPAADIGPIARRLIGNQYGRWRSRVRGLPEFLGALPSAVMAEEMETPGPGQIKALVCFAGNPALSVPNGDRLARAMAKLDTMIAVDFYINETSRHAHLVLPPTHVFESGNYDLLMYGFTVRNVAKYSPPIVERPAGGRDDWEILSELALHVAFFRLLRLRRLLRRATARLPERTIDLLLRLGLWGDHFVPWRKGLRLDALGRRAGGVDLGALVPEGRRKIRTPDGRVRLAPPLLVADIHRVEEWVDRHRAPAESLVLIGRRHLRSNNSWMHNIRSLAKGRSRSQLLMNPADAGRLLLQDGAAVRVRGRAGEVEAILAVTEEMMPGVVSLPHGFGHVAAAGTLRVAGRLAGPSVNSLTDEFLVEPVVGTSILNGVPVTVEASPEPSFVLRQAQDELRMSGGGSDA